MDFFENSNSVPSLHDKKAVHWGDIREAEYLQAVVLHRGCQTAFPPSSSSFRKTSKITAEHQTDVSSMFFQQSFQVVTADGHNVTPLRHRRPTLSLETKLASAVIIIRRQILVTRVIAPGSAADDFKSTKGSWWYSWQLRRAIQGQLEVILIKLVSLYFSPNTPKSNQVRRPWQFETSLGNWQLQIFLNARPRLLFSPQFLWAFAFYSGFCLVSLITHCAMEKYLGLGEATAWCLVLMFTRKNWTCMLPEE